VLFWTLAVGAADMTAAFQLALAVSQATTSDTSALKTRLVSGGVPAAAVSVGAGEGRGGGMWHTTGA
jgi:hypothetical protein